MRGYIIKVGKKTYATNAENIMDAENKFIEEFPKFENEKLIVSEVEDVSSLNVAVIVF